MAVIRPFRALRYNEDVITDINRKFSPLFDVVSPEEMERLYRIPNNSIHLSVPRSMEDALQKLQKVHGGAVSLGFVNPVSGNANTYALEKKRVIAAKAVNGTCYTCDDTWPVFGHDRNYHLFLHLSLLQLAVLHQHNRIFQ